MTVLSNTKFACLRQGGLILLAIFCLLRPAFASDTNAVFVPDAEDLLRSYLEIQGQLHATQRALETNRVEAKAAAASYQLRLEERLRLMEKTIADEHAEELGRIDHSERTILLAAGAFAVIAMLLLLLAAFLQWTAVNRLTSIAANFSASRQTGQIDMPPAPALEQSSARVIGLLEGLEQRIQNMEASVNTPHALNGNGNGAANGSSHPAAEETTPAVASNGSEESGNTIDLLLSKSQTLIKLDKPQEALNCLDQILALDPDNADAMVKKGAAFERLQLLDQAIQCYDHAIARDSSKTMAYLHKGGILNRLERHTEALACYEQALQPATGVKQ